MSDPVPYLHRRSAAAGRLIPILDNDPTFAPDGSMSYCVVFLDGRQPASILFLVWQKHPSQSVSTFNQEYYITPAMK